MQAIIALLSLPLMLLNLLGGLVSGVWLIVLGQWWAIGYGILGLFVSSFFISIALMPGFLLAAPAMALIERGKVLAAVPFLILNMLYTYGVITAWCMFVFFLFMRNANHESFFPLLIWSYGVATGPWSYMASQEQQGGSGESSAIAIFFAQLAYVIVGITAVLFDSSRQDLTALFAGIMGIAMMIQFCLTIAFLSAQRRPKQNDFQ